MADEGKTAQGGAATVAPNIKFNDMNLGQKLSYICKAALCIMTFGFAYPNIFND